MTGHVVMSVVLVWWLAVALLQEDEPVRHLQEQLLLPAAVNKVRPITALPSMAGAGRWLMTTTYFPCCLRVP